MLEKEQNSTVERMCETTTNLIIIVTFFFICSIATKEEDFNGWPRHQSPSAVQSATEERTEEGSVV